MFKKIKEWLNKKEKQFDKTKTYNKVEEVAERFIEEEKDLMLDLAKQERIEKIIEENKELIDYKIRESLINTPTKEEKMKKVSKKPTKRTTVKKVVKTTTKKKTVMVKKPKVVTKVTPTKNALTTKERKEEVDFAKKMIEILEDDSGSNGTGGVRITNEKGQTEMIEFTNKTQAITLLEKVVKGTVHLK